MDIHALDYQSFDKHQVHAWLNAARDQLVKGVSSVASSLNETHRSLWNSDNVDDSAVLAQWCHDNDLLTTHPAGGHTWSLRGVAFLHSSLNERVPVLEAWDRVHVMLRKVSWLNAAPEHLFPLHISDVLLFGSMTKNAKDCGDSDALVLVAPKSDQAQSRAATFWNTQNEWCSKAYGMMSFHRLVSDVVQHDGFCSWTLDPTVVEVLADQDPDFFLVSAHGKSWSPAQVSTTQMDEVSHAVCHALAHAPQLAQSQVWQQLSRAARRNPHVDQDILSDITQALRAAATPAQRQQSVWWAMVAPQGAFAQHHQLLTAADQHLWQQAMEEFGRDEALALLPFPHPKGRQP